MNNSNLAAGGFDYARTKIVATLGPASSSSEVIKALANAGADVFRLNMAHGNRKDHESLIRTIRELESETGPRGILVDLSGPKIRLGTLIEDPYECEEGEVVRFVRGQAKSSNEFSSQFERLVDLLREGDSVLLADGAVRLVVSQTTNEFAECQVVGPGTIRSRQGINLPGSYPDIPALTEHDLDCVKWAVTQEVDFLSLSFVQRPSDILDLKQLLADAGSRLPVIAKIEKPEALESLEEIVAATDGVMVARGDLGVEIDVAEVPIAQKIIVQLCNDMQKPVIVATEMLDSMETSPRPTRAEATDVANAVLDGADACMLSGETAVGEYPVQAVETMNRIILTTEQLLHERAPTAPVQKNINTLPTTSAVVYGAGCIADQLSAKLVVIATRSGATALAKSNQREYILTLGTSEDINVLRKMCIFWGVRPLMGAPIGDIDTLKNFVFEWGIKENVLESGDHVVFVAGRDTGGLAHNAVSVHSVP